MKKSTTVYSDIFNNRVQLPEEMVNIIEAACIHMERIDFFKYLNLERKSPETEYLDLSIHVAPTRQCVEISYGNGFIITNSFFRFVWHCDSYKQIDQIAKDFEHYAREHFEANKELKILPAIASVTK